MLTPFHVHAQMTGQYQAIGGGQKGNGNRGEIATLTILGSVIPCSISPVVFDFEIEDGISATTFVEQCEFLVSDGPTDPKNPGNILLLKKGTPCVLTVSNNQSNPAKTIQNYNLQLWKGGLLAGGLIWRFMLVDLNENA